MEAPKKQKSLLVILVSFLYPYMFIVGFIEFMFWVKLFTKIINVPNYLHQETRMKTFSQPQVIEMWDIVKNRFVEATVIDDARKKRHNLDTKAKDALFNALRGSE
jgi:hypothetical protein